MYKTIKIRLKLTEKQKSHLLAYEKNFHDELSRITKLISHRLHHNFRSIKITNEIGRYSHWFLYQSALHKYEQESKGKVSNYGKSSTWSPLNAKIKENTLVIHYGESFPVSKDELILKAENKQLYYVISNEIIRIDLVHDEKFWFANCLIRLNEKL